MIDADGGAISWTPPSTMNGDAGFTLEVDGAGGSATQTWQVDVVTLGVSAPKKGCGCAVAGPSELLGLLALGGMLRRLRRYRRSCR
jgi:MYXO-CTERM domain-containing protein